MDEFATEGTSESHLKHAFLTTGIPAARMLKTAW
jgi:hypothetical protein